MKPAPRPREYQCGDCVSREDASWPTTFALLLSRQVSSMRSFPVVRRYCLFGTLVFVPSHITVSYHLTSAGLLRQTLREAALRRPAKAGPDCHERNHRRAGCGARLGPSDRR